MKRYVRNKKWNVNDFALNWDSVKKRIQGLRIESDVKQGLNYQDKLVSLGYPSGEILMEEYIRSGIFYSRRSDHH